MRIHDIVPQGNYTANEKRYTTMNYRRCGKSGLLLPEISLGLWHNFGHTDKLLVSREMLRTAFDLGITHFDLANNYGPPYGAAEENFGTLLKKDFLPYRDELIISTKAGWDMWPGPYGNWGSRKYLVASLDQSLKRMGQQYVDIFYHHRPDPNTPVEETMTALDHMVRQGKALYVGISQYNTEQSQKATSILRQMGTPCLIHQPKYNILDRWVENGLLNILEEEGVGSIAFSPLAQGLLTEKYIGGFPDRSRAIRDGRYLSKDQISTQIIKKIKKLAALAQNRQQSLAQMSISWILKDPRITSVLIGASTAQQIKENVESLNNTTFTQEEINQIDKISGGE